MSASVLDWPPNLERTDPAQRVPANKFSTGYNQTRSELDHCLTKMMSVDSWRLSDVSGGSDPGVVVRWSNDGEDFAVACDAYTKKRDNLREIYLWLEETRKRSERNVSTADVDFAAARLMPPDTDDEQRPPPHEILEVAPDASPGVIRAVYREKIKETHADVGGSTADTKDLNWAKEQMLDETDEQ